MTHLGGWVEGGDPATWLPSVWAWAVRELGASSAIDVGCGDGRAVDWFAAAGLTALGVEGTPQDHPLIVQHDYQDGPYRPDARYDVAWCCEFVEHVDEVFVPNFLETFKAAGFVLMTHAEPGQPGTNHVNCRPRDYWVGALAAAGFGLNEHLTAEARRAARENDYTWSDPDGTVRRNHFLRSGLVFVGGF